ncbi:TSUP family transporter, partial [Acidimicrobiaceae bacterium USS-CC1]|nr:TSUP family transporter [Acidiferrimicrobium australe]
PAPTATATRPARRVSRMALLRLGATATVVGLLTGFFGVGGGFVIVPALVLALGFSMPEAVGTSLLVIGINSAASLGARLGGHVHLDWTLLAVFTLAAVAGSVAGNRVASKVNSAVLTRAFTVLLVVVAVYTAARSIPHLA